ncbi:MAG TPA: NAD-dependent epimerase/dehydratase family protein [Chloroflexota bacterium]|nr:NAD-dependent epimerase/dehydratase family protein [Chloroflexota bacterium]
MKVLIIGGTGLISTPLTRLLLERGDEVTLYNRGRTEVRVPPGAETIVGDRKDYAAFEAQLQGGPDYDCVIDMICFLPEEAESLVRAVRGKTRQLIVCSTVDVFARPAERYPIPDDHPLGGVSQYGRDKAECERILMAAHARGDVPVTVLRPAQTYGEGRDFIHVFGRGGVWKRLRRGKPVIVHGDGSSLWVACHIDDVARAFAGACGNDVSFGRAYNVTGEEVMTWDEYTERAAEGLGAPAPRIVHIPTDVLAQTVPDKAKIIVENFRFHNVFETANARRDLGFRYTIPFVEGVRRNAAWLDERGLIEGSDGDPWQDEVIAAWERLVAALPAPHGLAGAG